MKENQQRKKIKIKEKLSIRFFKMCYITFLSTTYLPTIFIVTFCHKFNMTYLPYGCYVIFEWSLNEKIFFISFFMMSLFEVFVTDRLSKHWMIVRGIQTSCFICCSSSCTVTLHSLWAESFSHWYYHELAFSVLPEKLHTAKKECLFQIFQINSNSFQMNSNSICCDDIYMWEGSGFTFGFKSTATTFAVMTLKCEKEVASYFVTLTSFISYCVDLLQTIFHH